MVEFLNPRVIVRELASIAGVSPIASTSIPIFHATATRGPINRPVLVTSLADFVSVYGNDDGGYGFQSASGFFGNDGRRLYVNRTAHYTDITDLATLTAIAAELELDTNDPLATAATKSSNVGPFNLHPSNLPPAPYELIVAVDGAPADTYTLTPTRGTNTAGAFVGAGTPGDQIVFSVTTPDGTNNFTYTVGAATTTINDWVADITPQIPGASCAVVGGVLEMQTDGYGTGFNVGVVSGTGTALTQSGFAVGAGTAGGPFVDLSETTAAELDGPLAAAWTGGGGTAVTAEVDGSLKLDTVATGVAATLGDVTGSLAGVIVFTPSGLVTGAGAGGASVPTLKFIATSEGEHGNDLAVTTERFDRTVATLSETVTSGSPAASVTISSTDPIRVGMQLSFQDTVTGGIARGVVEKISGNKITFVTPIDPVVGDLVVGNAPLVVKETFTVTPIIEGVADTPLADLSMSSLDTRFYVGNVIGVDPQAIDPRQRLYVEVLGAPVSATEDPRPADVTVSDLTGGVDSDPLVDLDWVGSASTETGIQASNKASGFSMLAIPGIETAAVHRAMMDYANLKKRHLAMTNPPPGLTDAQVVDYVTNTATLFGTYIAMHAGELVILRESSGAEEVFPAVGYTCGAYARNDAINNVASAPAGVRKGLIAGVLGAGNDNYYASEARRDTLYPEPGVNTIYRKEGRGVVIWGQLTLDPNSDRGAIGVRRALISIENDLESLSDFVLFEINNTVLREEFKTRVGAYLRQRWRDGVLQGDNTRQAYEIVCDETNNPPSVVNARQFFADILVNLLPGIDYVIINIQRDDRSLIEELASAA